MATISQTTFQEHFLEQKCMNSYYNLTEVCSYISNIQYDIIGSYNDLAPIRWQAIISANDGLVCSCIYASLGLNELKFMK